MPLSRTGSFQFLFILFSAIVVFSACQPEIDGDVPPPTTNPPGNTTALPKTITEIFLDEGDTVVNHTSKLTFTSSGKIASIESASMPGYKDIYTYQNGKFTVDLYEGAGITLKVIYLLNSSGKVDSSFQYNVGETDTITEKYIYNSGKLITIKEYQNSPTGYVQTDQTNLTYDGLGNVSREQSQSNGTINYTYYPDLKNPFNYFPDQQDERYLIKTMSSSNYNFTYTYTFDSQGRITEKKAIDVLNDYIGITKYTY